MIKNKKLLCVILAIIVGIAAITTAVVLIFSGEEEAIIPATQLIHREIEKTCKVAFENSDGTKLITSKDIKEIAIMYREGENRYLEIRFTEDGEELFEDAVDDYDTLVLTFDGNVLTDKVIANEYEPEKAKIKGDYPTIMKYFNQITKKQGLIDLAFSF